MEIDMKRYRWLVIQILCIVGIWGSLFLYNQTAIQSIWQQETISIVQKSFETFLQLMGISSQHNSTETEIHSDEVVYNTSESPIILEETILSLENYQVASEAAMQFNDHIDLTLLNEYFTNLVNNSRSMMQFQPLVTGNHLHEGVSLRVNELSQYHYFASTTLNGESFRTAYELVNVEQRLAENLYELYISTTDIHLKTWQDMAILAEFLFEQLDSTNQSELYENFTSQYLAVRAAPSDFRIETTPYVRLVVVLAMDTQ